MLKPDPMAKQSRRSSLQLLCSCAILAALPACSKKSPSKSVDGAVAQKAAAPGKRYRLGWTARSEWLPVKIMESQGYLKKRAREFGVTIEVVQFSKQSEVIDAFARGSIDAMGSTTFGAVKAASQGRESTVVLASQFPYATHAVIHRGKDLGSIRGGVVLAEKNSAAHYLLTRAMDSASIAQNEVRVFDAPREEALEAYAKNPKAVGTVAANPRLQQRLQQAQTIPPYSNLHIPRELMELLVVKSEALQEAPGLGKALCAAWLDATATLDSPEGRSSALKVMAHSSPLSREEFTKTIPASNPFPKKGKILKTMQDRGLVEAVDKVKRLGYERGLLDKNDFGVSVGPESNARLRFDTSYLPTGPSDMVRR